VFVAEPRSLVKTLTATCSRALEVAATACVAAQQFELRTEHLVQALLDDRDSDLRAILEHYAIDAAPLRALVAGHIQSLRSGNTGKPTFGAPMLLLLQDAWVYASAELGEFKLRSGALLVRLAVAPSRYWPLQWSALDNVAKDLRRSFKAITAASFEASALPLAADASRGPLLLRPDFTQTIPHGWRMPSVAAFRRQSSPGQVPELCVALPSSGSAAMDRVLESGGIFDDVDVTVAIRFVDGDAGAAAGLEARVRRRVVRGCDRREGPVRGVVSAGRRVGSRGAVLRDADGASGAPHGPSGAQHPARRGPRRPHPDLLQRGARDVLPRRRADRGDG
jgi:hypothetical protein